MFNFNLSFLNVLRPGRRKDLLPMDFGAMYFLYPTESEQYIGFGSTGIMDKVVDLFKTKFQRKNSDMEHYQSESFF